MILQTKKHISSTASGLARNYGASNQNLFLLQPHCISYSLKEDIPVTLIAFISLTITFTHRIS